MSNAAIDLVKFHGDAFATDLLAALGSCYAMIEFDPSGVIQTANAPFLAAMGYTEGEIAGRHHRIFCDAQTVDSLDYRRMWEELAAGTSFSREFKRLRKDGRLIWIRASYMPLKDPSGRVYRVVKLAQDSTEEHERQADVNGKQNAVSRAQAVIEFTLDGTVVAANENFLAAVGYGLDEIVGKHHSMFVDATEARGQEYKELWRKLNAGEYVSGEFRRIGRNGKEIWIQASYNPIFDLGGKPCKVVKYATDVTEQKIRNADFEGQLAAIGKSQAVISFGLDGTVTDANPNFLTTMGYTLAEIKGRHHSMFVDEDFARSADYRAFWEKLNRGEYVAGRFRRIGRNGKEVWIQASYNPILDLAGRPFKVVKYATDVTDQVKLMSEIKNLAASASRLTEASGALFGLATRMNEDSQETSKQAGLAQVSAESVSKGVASVATNTEELKASIREIARSATTASRMSDDTKAQAARTNETIAKLGASSKEIGNVIKVISSIAQQTNLLALNATIEAARAGEAGRGFAVVANEVKELAKQTAKATEEIAGRIGAIQADSSDAIKAIADIDKSIEGLNQIAGTIAAAVEEQAATSNEVARIVQDQSRAVEGIAGNVRTVSQAAGSTSDGARQVIDSATGLKELAASLESMVARLQKGT